MKKKVILPILSNLIMLIGFFSLAGCLSMRQSTLSDAQTHFSVRSRQAIVSSLMGMKTWQAEGVFSFESSNQVGMAHFRVDVTAYTWRVQISSALNLVQMTIGNDALGIWYTDQHGHILHTQSIEDSMKEQFGFALPIATLLNWMKGLALSDQGIVTLNSFNQLVELQEKGWILHYSHYGLYQNQALPGVIEMAGHGEKIKMVIDKWY